MVPGARGTVTGAHWSWRSKTLRPQHLMHMKGGAEVINRSAAAKDPALAARLWDVSSTITGVPR
jgi:hypothetical protein